MSAPIFTSLPVRLDLNYPVHTSPTRRYMASIPWPSLSRPPNSKLSKYDKPNRREQPTNNTATSTQKITLLQEQPELENASTRQETIQHYIKACSRLGILDWQNDNVRKTTKRRSQASNMLHQSYIHWKIKYLAAQRLSANEGIDSSSVPKDWKNQYKECQRWQTANEFRRHEAQYNYLLKKIPKLNDPVTRASLRTIHGDSTSSGISYSSFSFLLNEKPSLEEQEEQNLNKTKALAAEFIQEHQSSRTKFSNSSHYLPKQKSAHSRNSLTSLSWTLQTLMTEFEDAHHRLTLEKTLALKRHPDLQTSRL